MIEQGITTRDHVRELLSRSSLSISNARTAVSLDKPMTAKQREQMARDLAGVIGACESVRLWLSAGAPR